MLGKTFKGMTDAMLEWQTERLLDLEIGREEHAVLVRPELVVEITFDGVQVSPQYPGGWPGALPISARQECDRRRHDRDGSADS